jgi:hypothetical protein
MCVAIVEGMNHRLKLCSCALALAMLTACRSEDAEPPAEPEPAVAALDGDTAVFASEPEREALPSHRIYYTLTQHEWYARGEPLMHEQRPFHAGGMPVAASAGDMQHLGEYQGVDYYARTGDTADAVYVPVFEGYWQPFRSEAAQRPVN